MGCIYTEAKNYPREPAAHVAISEFFLFNVSFINFPLKLLILCYVRRNEIFYS